MDPLEIATTSRAFCRFTHGSAKMNFLTFLMLIQLIGVLGESEPTCKCWSNFMGCSIIEAAPEGFKCQCEHLTQRGLLLHGLCEGHAFPCIENEYCPGNKANYCACKLGGGNCDVYKEPLGDCSKKAIQSELIPGTAECKCHYHNGGCTISSPPPYGWKCVCQFSEHQATCYSWPIQCADNEICLDNDYSYCGCMKGGGNCEGYPDKPSCSPVLLSDTCDCTKSSDWSKGLYKVENVIYNTTNFNFHPQPPRILVNKNIPNNSTEIQETSFTISETVSETSSFSYASGVSIEVGTSFTVGIPFIGEASAHMTITGSHEYTWGNTITKETTHEQSFVCKGAPQSNTNCLITMKEAKIDVPYVMQVKHKIIPNCLCNSYGTWQGTHVYQAELSANSTSMKSNIGHSAQLTNQAEVILNMLTAFLSIYLFFLQTP